MGNANDSQITNDSRYGKVNKFTYDNSLIIQKVIEYQNAPDQLASCIHRCQFSQQFDHKNLIKLHKYEVNQLNISIYFEHYDYDLQQDIDKRKLNNNYYQEHEIITILDQLLSVLAYLQQQQIFHDDLRPQNIFLTPNGSIKLNQLWIYENQQYKQKYYAPEQLQPQLIQLNPYKSTVYTLGVTILQIMTLTSMDFIYMRNQVHQPLINEILHSTNYSHKLISRLQLLLQYSQQQRLDFIQLQAKQANLQSKLISSPPKTITSSQRYVYRASHSPLTRTIQPKHSHSPFTFRRIATTTIQPQSTIIQIPQIIQSSRQVLPQQSPIKIIKQKQQESMFTPLKQNKEIILEESTIQTDLDYRIQKALKQTNETLKKNYLVQ